MDLPPILQFLSSMRNGGNYTPIYVPLQGPIRAHYGSPQGHPGPAQWPGHALVLIASASAAARWSGDRCQGGIAGRFASGPDHQEVIVTSGCATATLW